MRSQTLARQHRGVTIGQFWLQMGKKRSPLEVFSFGFLDSRHYVDQCFVGLPTRVRLDVCTSANGSHKHDRRDALMWHCSPLATGSLIVT